MNKLCTILVLAVFISACTAGINNESVNQMKSLAVSEEQVIDELNEWIPVRNTFLIFDLKEKSNLSCLFVSEAKPQRSGQSIYAQIEVRILVNGKSTDPQKAVLSGGTGIKSGMGFSSHSFMATAKDLPPGTHSVTVECRAPFVPGNADQEIFASLRNRTLTVWSSSIENTEVTSEQ